MMIALLIVEKKSPAKIAKIGMNILFLSAA
jgi:hypothetical protein